MKHSTLTYYLLAIFCIIATSCVTDGVTDNSSNSKNPVLIKGGKVNLTITFPAASTRSITGTSEGMEKERKINDIHIYTFVEDKFVEEVQDILMSGENGAGTRNIEGNLSATYTSGRKMEFVVITNAESKGITGIAMNKGGSKAELYELLTYTYADKDWSENIPMWGLGTISHITEAVYYAESLTLKRAIAKVNVTVNGGAGLDKFQITKITVHNYNTKGYCAPIASEGPSIPASSAPSSDVLTSGSLEGSEGNYVENLFYIPEHKNIRVSDSSKVYLTIQAKVNNIIKDYTLPFIENGQDCDVLRNHVYIFNITSVKTDPDSSSLEYEVNEWDSEIVEVPPFS